MKTFADRQQKSSSKEGAKDYAGRFIPHYDASKTLGDLLDRGMIAAKLKVGSPDDPLEREADRVADQVMRMQDPQLQRQPEEEEEEEELIQTKSTGGHEQTVSPVLAATIDSMKGGGQPLPQSARDFFEPRFIADFSRVRIHAGERAAEIAGELNAKAFTIGQDVAFGRSQFAPGTVAGGKLIAHELAHVVQQTGWVCRTPDEEAPVLTLANPRFAGNWILQRILSGRIPRLSSRHNGRGGAVSKVQQALVDLGFELPMHQVDGSYGDETEEAIAQFRRRYGPSSGNILDGPTLEVLDRTAPAPGTRHRHTVDYERLLADGRLDITVGIGATDTTVVRRLSGRRRRYEDTGRPTEDLMAERFRTWMRGQGFGLELLGLSGNQYWKATKTMTWTGSDGTPRSRQIDIWINLVVPGAGASREFREGLSQDEITIYSGHARYGSGPDFDAKASPLENFRIGIDHALQAAGRRTRVEEARRHGVAIDEENDLLEMVRDRRFDRNRYRVLFFNACTSLAYLDEIREHIGGTGTTDVVATRRPSMFSRVESRAGLEEVQRFLEGILSAESVESIVEALNAIQRGRHRGTSHRYPRGGVYSSSGMGDNPRVP